MNYKIKSLLDFLETLKMLNQVEEINNPKPVTPTKVSVKSKRIQNPTAIQMAKVLYHAGLINAEIMKRGAEIVITEKGIDFLETLKKLYSCDATRWEEVMKFI